MTSQEDRKVASKTAIGKRATTKDTSHKFEHIEYGGV
jgi:hypothetical protein